MAMGCSLDFSYSFSNTSHLLSYDLCPLFSQHPSLRHEISEDTLPTRTNYVYEIALGKGIEKDGTLPEDLQCPHDSLVCMRAINTRPNHPSEPPRILQVIPVATRHTKPKFRIAKTTTGTDIQEPHLQLTVQGSEYMGMKQKAVFHIYCDEKSHEGSTSIGQLDHLYQWKGSHVFSWRSEHGCPKITAHGSKDDSDKTPDRHEEEENETTPPANVHEDKDSIIKTPSQTLIWFISLTASILLAIAFRFVFLKRYKHYILQLIHKLPISRRRHRSGEYDFLLEDIASEGSTVYSPGFRKYDTV
ncbi:hypothetical protein AGABI1DRAFT_109210 [Agaricus bisporus var. burnettii JB137-S8]|uniref:Uncharacterized protein n=1 Tax=Agaricus bisporus var. burnettii (strain JB137-S8 / ATCC MYA-4627 / FGSC 10392) TaxID=597362 RepID=K5XMM7_AGABU|nr:uncharacterized protein AGABI1DRAFT_109210 [Agaricus bisporus var. burnettii JB137-S8]EKM75855.1 hypothetical protein AGABI1DRAFT_109210 [Agaricus bisporus var. burnettii JB137-S8]